MWTLFTIGLLLALSNRRGWWRFCGTLARAESGTFVVKVAVFFGVFIVTACGNLRLQSQWPAKLVSTANLSSDQKTLVIKAIDDWNKRSEKTIINTSDTGKGYPITIKMTDFASQGLSTRAGLATVTDASCLVELSNVAFLDANQDYIPSVLIHELGHCAGLQHKTDDSNDIMYPTTQVMASYSSDEIKSFLTRFFQSIAKLN